MVLWRQLILRLVNQFSETMLSAVKRQQGGGWLTSSSKAPPPVKAPPLGTAVNPMMERYIRDSKVGIQSATTKEICPGQHIVGDSTVGGRDWC
ncbi:hypothetical protein U1Q18_021300 [Sarracenia purpurea var. burkii]